MIFFACKFSLAGQMYQCILMALKLLVQYQAAVWVNGYLESKYNFGRLQKYQGL